VGLSKPGDHPRRVGFASRRILDACMGLRSPQDRAVAAAGRPDGDNYTHNLATDPFRKPEWFRIMPPDLGPPPNVEHSGRRHFKELNLKSKTRSVVVWALALSSAAVALGQVGTPGWKFGRNQCGPVGTPRSTTLAGCTACCGWSVIPTGPLNPAEVAQCNAYCAAVFASPNVVIQPGGPNPW